MIEFDPLHYPYASTRNVVYAKNGMCCAGNPSAASAGLQTLLKGGNAIDAAVAMALAQPVVEPSGNGLGCECFAIVWYKGKMYGINGSGPCMIQGKERELWFEDGRWFVAAKVINEKTH